MCQCVCTWKCTYKISLHGNYILSSVIGTARVVSKERCGFTSAGDLAKDILREAFLKKNILFEGRNKFLVSQEHIKRTIALVQVSDQDQLSLLSKVSMLLFQSRIHISGLSLDRVGFAPR